jgi:hypothetical protein
VKTILVYDDENETQSRFCDKLRAVDSLRDEYDVQSLNQDGFSRMMDELQSRRNAFRAGGRWDDHRIPLDDAAFLVIDYDLFQNSRDPFLTGEGVAYLARCFSACGIVVAVNQPPLVDFDLTLRGRPESFADLNITERHLDNPGLWSDGVQGFQPWYWPNLLNLSSSFTKRTDDIRANLDQPVWKALGFDLSLFDILPRMMTDFLGSDPTSITCLEFVTKSGSGLRAKDARSPDPDPDVLIRIGAARLWKWLERLLLPGQDLLVDAPHLISRFPSLITGSVEDIETWNQTASIGSHEQLGLDHERIETFRFEKDYWISRPVWFWDRVRSCDGIPEVREPWKVRTPEWVFCEDVSRFHGADEAVMFVADTQSPYSRRFVRRLPDYEYRPLARFAA